MQGLKVLVIVLGVLLVAGTVALGVAIVDRIEHRPPAEAEAVPGAVPLRTELPAGARIIAATLAADRLMLHIALAGGGEQVLLYDARSGALVATIDAPARP